MSTPVPPTALMGSAANASAAAAAGPAAVPAAAASAALSPAAAPPAPPQPAAARLDAHMSSALQRLWKSTLIVERGSGGGAAPLSRDDPEQAALERLMATTKPPFTPHELNTANLQQQLEGFVHDLGAIDRTSRELQLQVPRSIIECVESGSNPSFLTARHVSDTQAHNDAVRAQVFATTILRDQLQMRMHRWEQALTQQAEAGDQAAHRLSTETTQTQQPQQQPHSLNDASTAAHAPLAQPIPSAQ